MFFSLGLIIMYGISLNKCKSVFLKFWLKGEALTGRRGLINGCTYYSPVLISLLLKLKKIVKVAMETGFPCFSTI